MCTTSIRNHNPKVLDSMPYCRLHFINVPDEVEESVAEGDAAFVDVRTLLVVQQTICEYQAGVGKVLPGPFVSALLKLSEHRAKVHGGIYHVRIALKKI